MACGSAPTAPHTILASQLLVGPPPSALKSGPIPSGQGSKLDSHRGWDWGGGLDTIPKRDDESFWEEDLGQFLFSVPSNYFFLTKAHLLLLYSKTRNQWCYF